METLLEKLSSLPTATTERTRHLRIQDSDVCLWSPAGWENRWIEHLLPLFPELRLETLTVLGPAVGEDAEQCLSELIRIGHGWKQLYFITPNSYILAEGPASWVSLKRWLNLLATQDGMDSEGSISIHQETAEKASAMTFAARHHFSPIVNFSTLDVDDIPSMASLAITQEMFDLEPLVIVERGRQASCSNKEAAKNVWYEAENMSWRDIRSREILHEHDEVIEYGEPQGDRVQVDKYVNPLEYEW